MNTPIKKVLLFVVVLVLCYLTASYIGSWYDTVSYQGGSIFIDRSVSVPLAGFIISYIFFIPFIYGLFGIKRNKYWIIWPLLPAVLLIFGADKYHFYIPVLLIVAAIALAWIIRFIISKFRHPNSNNENEIKRVG